MIPLGVTAQEEQTEPPLEGVRTLIVDDDITACEYAQMILKKIGIDAEYALSGKAALSLMEERSSLKQPFQLVLADWKMPEMDGLALTRALRKRFGDNDLTIILTTYNWDEIMEEALDAGVDAFFAKPLFAGSIRQEIHDIMAKKRSDAKQIPVIALTANAFDEDVRSSLEAGMNSHLSKPVEPDALFQVLEKMIGK